MMNLLEKLDRESDVVDELRNHLELVLEGFLGGPLELAPVSEIVADPGYEKLVSEFLPKLNEAFIAFLSALLYALKTSLIDIELIDHRSYDLPEAHERLKNLVTELKRDVKLWIQKCQKKYLEPIIWKKSCNKIVLAYEKALAMCCINKVLLSTLPRDVVLRQFISETEPDDGKYTYESMTTLTVFYNTDHDQSWQSTEVQSFTETEEMTKKNRLKTFCAGASGGIPFPEYGVDIIDCSWWNSERITPQGGTASTNIEGGCASVTMASTEWEDNWLFQRRPPCRLEMFNLEPVQMVIPKPKGTATGVTLGSLDIDALSDLSENNSVASLDFSSTESESDRPQITGAVMKSLPCVEVNELNRQQDKVISHNQSAIPDWLIKPSDTSTITVNGHSSNNYSIIIGTGQQKQNSDEIEQNYALKSSTSSTVIPMTSSERKLRRPFIGPRIKASFDGKVVMESLEDSRDIGVHKAGDTTNFPPWSTLQGRSSIAYDGLSMMAFQEKTEQNSEEHLEFHEAMNTTETSSSLRSFSEEELDLYTSVSTERSSHRSPEGCTLSSCSHPQTSVVNLAGTCIGESPSVGIKTTVRNKEDSENRIRSMGQSNITISDLHQDKHNRSSADTDSAVDIANCRPLYQKIPAMSKTKTQKDKRIVNASFSSGRGSTASMRSASSVQLNEFVHPAKASTPQMNEICVDHDRSVIAKPNYDIPEKRASRVQQSFQKIGAHETVIEKGVVQMEDKRIQQREVDTLSSSQFALIHVSSNEASQSVYNHNQIPSVDAMDSKRISNTTDKEKIIELDRDQDIYCVLPASKYKVNQFSLPVTTGNNTPNVNIDLKIRTSHCNAMPNQKEHDERSLMTPIRSISFQMTTSQPQEDKFIPTSKSFTRAGSVDTIPVPKYRHNLPQVFPQPKPATHNSENSMDFESSTVFPGVVPLKSMRGSFGVQIYPLITPAPQPRPRRSGGRVEKTQGKSNVMTKSPLSLTQSSMTTSQDSIDITPLKGRAIEEDLQGILPNVKHLASCFYEPMSPGISQSSTLPIAAKCYKETVRKQDKELIRRVNKFNSYT